MVRLTRSLAILCAGTAALWSSASPAAENITYSYDSLGRLVRAAHAGSINAGVVSAYCYDRADNRKRVSVAGVGGAAGSPAVNCVNAPDGTDFNGDGIDDVLWRNDDGRVTDWLATPDGGFISNDAHAIVTVTMDWHVVGTGDFNGDGRDDILWRHVDGRVSNWLGQADGGFVSNDVNALQTVDNSWKVVGVGDFNGDGRSDVLWRNASGRLSDWLGTASGGFIDNLSNVTNVVAAAWKVAGTGDFNGDGRSDILWRNDDGRLSEWLGQPNGSFYDNGSVAGASVDTSWHVAGTGDFNGDGRSDILWRNDDGHLVDWLGNPNGSFTDNTSNASFMVTTTWTVVQTGDYNGDGREDILWRNSSGGFTSWLATPVGGFTSNDANAYTVITTAWFVMGPVTF